MAIVASLHQDVYSPLLFNSVPLDVSVEQKIYIKKILDVCCSDSRFSQKAYDTINYILTAGSIALPEIESLSPSSATIGSASFTLHVIGKEFDPESKIIWNGSAEPTTFVSETELTTGVNMATATTATTVPVAVQSGMGVMSESVPFTFNAASVLSSSVPKSDASSKVAINQTKK